MNEGNFELASPLISDQLCMANVMETKSVGMMRSWRTVLAIITTDSFLHLFYLPSYLRVQSGSAAEVAFHALVPPVEIPSEKNTKSIQTASFKPKLWSTQLLPSVSIILPNSKIHFINDEVNSSFEITETILNQGVGKVFSKIGARKILFRTRTYEQTKEWVAALIAPK